MIKENQDNSISEFMRRYRDLTDGRTDHAKGQRTIKISLLASFTINGLKEILSVKCSDLGFHADVQVAGYNQYAQEILDKDSRLYQFQPDIIFLFIDTHSLLGDSYFSYSMDKSDRHTHFSKIKSLVDMLKKNLKSKIIVHNFEVPSNIPLSIMDGKDENSLKHGIMDINNMLAKEYMHDSQVFVFDLESFCSNHGKENIHDPKMYYLGDVKISMSYLPKLCDSYVSYIKPLAGLSRKCIVLDLDNTLWGGIVGEDGFSHIRLGPTPEGRPFMEFQKYLLALSKKGIILAINSRNNNEDAMEVISKHPYMILREENFSAMQINWNDKAENMKAIAEELNIGLDSMVFFDDDAMNRERIKDELPQVKVIDMPKDPALYLRTIEKLDDFETYILSEEDLRRGEMYVQQKKRAGLQKSSMDIDEFLKSLEMTVTISKANEFNIPRIAQLTKKTNQFNMTTRRYEEEDIARFSSDPSYLVFCVKVEDKFGDNGITGVSIVKKGHDHWDIDTFLLSCRIIGRKVEETMLTFILENAKNSGVGRITAGFIETKKNAPAKDFYKRSHFMLIEENDAAQVWEHKIGGGTIKYPAFIKIKDEGFHG
jgi:FkbH-like protein